MGRASRRDAVLELRALPRVLLRDLQARIDRVVFAAYGTDVPGFRPPLGGGITVVAEWVNAQPGWPRLEVVGGLLRERAVGMLRAFPWTA